MVGSSEVESVETSECHLFLRPGGSCGETEDEEEQSRSRDRQGGFSKEKIRVTLAMEVRFSYDGKFTNTKIKKIKIKKDEMKDRLHSSVLHRKKTILNWRDRQGYVVRYE